MASDDIQNLLKSGIEAARSGNKVVARSIFEQVIKLDAQNELAWMWLASVLESTPERQRALQKVLSINPQNERARQALAKLMGGAAPAETEAPAPRKAPAESLPVRQAALPPLPPVALPEDRLRTDVAQPRRSSGMSPVLFYGGLLLALVLIIGAVALLLVQLGNEDETVTATAQPFVVVATTVPPAATLRPAFTLPPEALAGNNDLPPTWTPSPSPTSPPTDTPPPPPITLNNFQLIFAGAENPVSLTHLELIQADGANQRTLEVNLQASDVELAVVSTETPQPQSITPDEALAPTVEGEVQETPVPDQPSGTVPLYDNIEFFDPAYSPDGRFVAFTVQIAPEIQELFLLTLANNRVRQLTTLGGRVTDGADWYPDGTQIAFSSNARGDFDVYVVKVDGGDVTNLTAINGQNREPTWSPDGTTLVFSSDRATPGELEIWSLPAAGGIATQLTDDVNSSFSPAFSSDGLHIAFVSNRGGDNDVYVMNADGTSEQLLTISDGGADDRDPAWSPDDNWVVFSSTREDERALQLWIMRTNGTDLRQLTQGNGNSRFADWLPLEEQN